MNNRKSLVSHPGSTKIFTRGECLAQALWCADNARVALAYSDWMLERFGFADYATQLEVHAEWLRDSREWVRMAFESPA